MQQRHNGCMKFALAIDKKNAANLGQAKGHNHREHATASQLANRAAWLTPQGMHTLKRWDAKLVDQAKALAKRRDAVLAIELSVQVGNQTEWREPPSEDCPEGRPMRGNSKRMNALIEGVRQAIEREIGWDRVISAVLHTDESSPHVQLLFAPITSDGKLQAKEWVGGAAKCAQLRERIYRHVNQHLPCEYTKGAPGGLPHDPNKAAGKPEAPGGVIGSLRAKVQQLEQQVQALFSQLKAEQRKRRQVQAEYDEFTEQVAKRDQAQRAKLSVMQAQLDQLRPRPQKVAGKAAERPESIVRDDTPHPPAPSPLKRGPGEPSGRA